MAQHLAARLYKYDVSNPVSGVKVEEEATPEPGPNQVRVRMNIRPINPSDVFCLQGLYPGFHPEKLPAVPGLEGMGSVQKCGAEAWKFSAGQRVVGAPWPAETGNGTWQQYVVADEDVLHAVPDTVPDIAAAQFFINPITAFGFFDVLKIPQGEWLIQVIQLAKHKGVRTINVVRRNKYKDDLKKLGADVVINSEEEDVVEQTKAATGGKGAWAGTDCVGGELTGHVLSAIRANGRLLLYGAMSSLMFQAAIPDVLFQNKVIRGFWVKLWLEAKPEEEQKTIVQEVLNALGDNIITTYLGHIYPLKQVQEAVMESMKPARGGKVFLEG